jgi:maltooligosyltrehalose trehalohydrolase
MSIGPSDGPADPRLPLGAWPVDAGTRFEVWAPNADHVEIVLGDERAVSLHADPERGTWVGRVDGVGHDDRYRIRLDTDDELPDPASRHQPDGVAGPSAIVDTRTFHWTDDAWTGVSLEDLILYELHVGTFTPEGTFDTAIGQLDRLVELGVTAIELMPVNAFPGRRNWGYDGVFVSAVQASYGGPEGLARLVDAAHARGLGVVLDVVYNHIGPEGNVLGRFGPYFTDAYVTPWGPALNFADAGSDHVRRYFVESAVGFVRDFHVDGLRLDAVHAIVDPTAHPFVAELSEAVHRAGDELGREVLVTIESSANEPRLVVPVDEHGLGGDAVWADDVHHALRVAVTGDRGEYYVDYDGADDFAAALEHRWVYRGQYSPFRRRRHGAPADDLDHRRFVVFGQNHDHVGNTPRGERLLHAAGPADPRLRLVAAAVLLSPFTPLLFMGEEYGEQAPFPYFVDHADPDLVAAVRRGRTEEFSGMDWDGGVADPADPGTFEAAVLDPSRAEHEPQAGLLAWYTELIRVRRSTPALTSPRADQAVRVHAGEGPARTVVLARTLDGVSATVVLHFSDAEIDPAVLDLPDHAPLLASVAASPGAIDPWSARLYVAFEDGDAEAVRRAGPPGS